VRTLDVGEMVDDFLQLLRRVIGEDVELAVNALARASRRERRQSQLEQVLLNLCTNARQAMPAAAASRWRRGAPIRRGRRQRAPWAAVGDWAEVRVVDTGEGMEEATRVRASSRSSPPSPTARASAWRWCTASSTSTTGWFTWRADPAEARRCTCTCPSPPRRSTR